MLIPLHGTNEDEPTDQITWNLGGHVKNIPTALVTYYCLIRAAFAPDLEIQRFANRFYRAQVEPDFDGQSLTEHILGHSP